MSQNPYLTSATKRSFDLAIAAASAPAYLASLGVAAGISPSAPTTKHKRAKPSKELFEIAKLDFTRSSKLSRFAIASGLNELPQIVNIFNGDMSVIGPRPLIPEELEKIVAALPPTLRSEWLDTMPHVKPGLVSTFGIAAHCKLSRKDRARMDIYDAKHASLRNDIRLLGQLGKVCHHAARGAK